DNGTYTATIEVTDSGGTGSDSLVLTVANVAPTANAGPDLTCNEGSTAVFHGSASDPGTADSLTYTWVVRDAMNNPVASGAGANFSFTPTDNGLYTATLTVTDDDGGTHSDTAMLQVNNVGPVAYVGGASAGVTSQAL